MKLTPQIACLVLLAVCIAPACTSRADTPNVPTSGGSWGPSWVGSGPPGGFPRPQHFDKCMTRITLADDGSPVGMGVRMWIDGPVEKGHEYQLLCQLRVHTAKGEFGPLLGNAAQPGGTTFTVAEGTADDHWLGLEGAVDITRKELSTLTNLPAGKLATIRIEPQLFDKTTGKFLTEPKTDAIILLAEVSDKGRVRAATSLASWIEHNGQYSSEAVAGLLNSVDVFDGEGNGIADAIGSVLSIKDMPDAAKLKLLKATPKNLIYTKQPKLYGALTDLAANSKDPELKAAAEALVK